MQKSNNQRKMTSMTKDSQKDTFIAEAASLLLAAFISIEIYSLLKLFFNKTLILLRMESMISISAIGLGLLGICGLLRKSEVGGYLSLLSVIFGAAPNCWRVAEIFFTSQFEISAFIPSISLVVLGVLIAILIFKMDVDQNTLENPRPSASSINDPKPSDTSYAIETENVTKKYFLGPNVISAVNGINLKIRKGEFVSIMGPSGSGKSTLLNLLGALDKPTSGRVLIAGVDISKLNDEELAELRNRKIGFVFQAYNLITRSTVKRNMELPALVKGLPKEKRMQRINELLSVVGLQEKLYRKPKTLSGGEQQRVAIARALMNDPEIVLADEPTGNVDSKTGHVIMSFFRRLNRERGTTMVVVTHDPEVARMTDRIIYIRDGRIVKEEYLGGTSA